MRQFIKNKIIFFQYQGEFLKPEADSILYGLLYYMDGYHMRAHSIRRDSKHLQLLINAFSKFINPFDTGIDQQQLFSISSGKAASPTVQEYLIYIEENAEK